MLASIASRPRLAIALVTLAFGTPYAIVVTLWFAMVFTMPNLFGLFGVMECCVAASALVAPALAGLWLRAPAAVRKSRARLAAILATALGWSATIVAFGLHERTMRAFGHGTPLVSVDYFRFVTEDFHVLWTIWIATTYVLLALIVGSWLTLFTPWFASAWIGALTLRLVEHHADATARAGRDDRGGRGR